jgi:hypothetical protein
MQSFQDSTTLQAWAFEDDVVVTGGDHNRVFTSAHGVILDVPKTLIPYVAHVPTADEITAQQAAATVAALRVAAQTALDKSDVTIIRCYEHAVAVPAQWTAYRAALRAIVAGDSTPGALPTMPTYPVGT